MQQKQQQIEGGHVLPSDLIKVALGLLWIRMARNTRHYVPKLVLVLLLWPLRPAAVFPACFGAILQLFRSASAIVHIVCCVREEAYKTN
jgi:hypothetical protein